MSEEVKRKSLVRPTIDTLFKIDFEWWASKDSSWKASLVGLLTPEEKEKYSKIINGDILIDIIDVQTGRVEKVDGLRSIIYLEISTQESFVHPHIAITEGIFRLFMKNGNAPLSPVKMAELLNKDAKIILRTLLGVRPPKGIRPIS
jgi:hypothetical protein